MYLTLEKKISGLLELTCVQKVEHTCILTFTLFQGLLNEHSGPFVARGPDVADALHQSKYFQNKTKRFLYLPRHSMINS
jgi:hypothetical protein